MRRFFDKISSSFDHLNAQAKQALEANLNFVITQCLGGSNVSEVPQFSDSVISLRSMQGWKFGTFEMKTAIESKIWDSIKVPTIG